MDLIERPAHRGEVIIPVERCAGCHRPLALEPETIDGSHLGCYVPDIHSPSWAGFGRATDDVLVAPPSARVVR